jgi:hypothetical protein
VLCCWNTLIMCSEFVLVSPMVSTFSTRSHHALVMELNRTHTAQQKTVIKFLDIVHCPNFYSWWHFNLSTLSSSSDKKPNMLSPVNRAGLDTGASIICCIHYYWIDFFEADF